MSTHLAPRGGVEMVNVGAKAVTERRAQAESRVSMNRSAFELLAQHAAPKGDVLGTARIAGILAAKRTAELIPLCHALPLSHVGIELDLEPATCAVRILASVETQAKTGVEMEALVAASTAALTVYDMLKAADRAMQIGPTRVLSKSGGASGDFHASPAPASPAPASASPSRRSE
ncbi:MAG TPA: cyclic pyranopterin monophosphate synthase MoaC [Polyangiaceae bacterium]|nr:cyclic pyranopterin monophosphate synthase MoaC [Polyangiaceae bacterium]